MAYETWVATSPAGATGAVLVDRTHVEAFGPVFESADKCEAFQNWVKCKFGKDLSQLTRSLIRSYVSQFESIALTRCESCDALHWNVTEDSICEDCVGTIRTCPLCEDSEIDAERECCRECENGKNVVCGTCSGNGGIGAYGQTCSICHGTGTVTLEAPC